MKNKIALLTATLAVAGLAQVANAITVYPPSEAGNGLWLVDSANLGSATYVPGAANGFTTFAGSVGGFFVDISATGSTTHTGSSPTMDLDVAAVTDNGSSGTLEVFYSNGSFGPTTGTFTLYTHGPSAGTVTSGAYMGTGGFFDTTTTLVSPVADPSTVSGSISGNGYYVTLADFITGSETSVDTTFSVPDGSGTMMLLGIGLSGIAMLRKKISA